MASDTPINNDLAKQLTKDDVCLKCLGELDTGWECNDCDYDAIKHKGASDGK